MRIKYQLVQNGQWHIIDNFDNIPLDVYTIDCMYNNLVSLPEWTNLLNLHNIHCNNNDLTSLPEWNNLINLQEIWCGHNNLTSLPEWNNLLNLKTINCSYNKLTNLPEWNNLVNLQVIDSNTNNLTNLPEWTNLTNLHTISCVFNEITTLPNWDNLDLTYINCSHNNLTSLPSLWAQFPNLTTIIYHNNPIEYIPPHLLRRIEQQQEGQDIYNDKQNIHNHQIQQCLTNNINYLLSTPPTIPFDQVIEEIENECLVYDLLMKYIKDDSVHSVLNVSFKDILISVWNKIRIHKDKLEIIKILNIEMLDSECKCFTGRLTRLVNCLNVFDENIKMEISGAEQMGAISKLLYEKYPEEEDYKRELRKEFIERGYLEEDIIKWSSVY